MDHKSGDHKELLHEAEQRAAQVLGPELKRHLELSLCAFNLIGKAINRAPEVSMRDIRPSRWVSGCLLTRISNDVHCAAMLALHGYAVQAATIVASTYEVAYAVALIGGDDEQAKVWIDHDDPTRSFFKGKVTIRKALENLRVPNPQKEADADYKVYRQLCMAKHANPLFQEEHGIYIDDEYVSPMNGPDISEPAVRTAWFALEHVCRLAYVALASFVENHLPPGLRNDLVQEVQSLAKTRSELHDEAVKRWGNQDPFPSKW